MEKEFISYEQALALKELGFNEKCFVGYRDSEWIGTDGPNSRYFHAQLLKNSQFDELEYCSAPLYQQAFRFFREKYNLYGTVGVINNFSIIQKTEFIKCIYNSEIYNTYEEAESACLDKLIEIMKSL